MLAHQGLHVILWAGYWSSYCVIQSVIDRIWVVYGTHFTTTRKMHGQPCSKHGQPLLCTKTHVSSWILYIVTHPFSWRPKIRDSLDASLDAGKTISYRGVRSQAASCIKSKYEEVLIAATCADVIRSGEKKLLMLFPTESEPSTVPPRTFCPDRCNTCLSSVGTQTWIAQYWCATHRILSND